MLTTSTSAWVPTSTVWHAEQWPQPPSGHWSAAAKARAAEADAELKAITDGIKTELSSAHPDATEVVLSSPHLARPLQLQAVERWTVDSKRLKTEDPTTYVRWARQSTSWRLAPIAD